MNKYKFSIKDKSYFFTPKRLMRHLLYLLVGILFIYSYLYVSTQEYNYQLERYGQGMNEE